MGLRCDRRNGNRAQEKTRRGWQALCVIIAFSIGALSPPFAASDVRQALVKIYAVENRPDYDNPWNRKGPKSYTGSGAILPGNRILTNAHVIRDQTFLQVRRHGQAHQTTATVLAVAHDADLALLSVADAAFFEGVTPLRLGSLPHIQDPVTVYGFPIGGDTLSTTSGVVSRIEHRFYAHSALRLLAVQLDAAINNGNSGGPVLVDQNLVGVVMQAMDAADNIGYMVPAPVIQHVLSDIEDGRYDGFPELGIHAQSLDNTSVKRLMRMPLEQSGVLITQVIPGASAHGHLLAGDILIGLGGQAIGDNGTVAFRPGERTHLADLIQRHQVGDTVSAEVIRAGVRHTVRIPLVSALGTTDLVSGWRYDQQPSYYIYGGLVFCPLTQDYLRTWGKRWADRAPAELLSLYQQGVRTAPDEEVVIVMKVLSSELNTGYDSWVNQRITAVNHHPIRNLRDLVTQVEQSQAPFITFETSRRYQLVIDRERAAATHQSLLQTYAIPKDRSPDVRPSRVAAPHLSVGH